MEYSKKKSILFIVQLPPPVHGSAVMNDNIRSSKIINEEFDSIYLNITTATTNMDGGKFKITKIFRFLIIFMKLFYILLKEKIDLVYFTINPYGFAFYKETILVFLLKLFRKKILYHFHGRGVKKAANNFLKKLIYRLVFSNSKLILLSEYLYYDVKFLFSRDDIYFLPNGIKGGENSEKIYYPQNKKVKILYLSNMKRNKGSLNLLKSSLLLKKWNLNFIIEFVGNFKDEGYKNEFFNFIEKNELSDYVKYLGAKYGDEKMKILKESDIFVLPTYYDCFPLVILEAMAEGKPVVSTFEGAIRSIVENGKSGFLSPQHDYREMAEKLKILIGNRELRKRMGEEGFRRYSENFTIEIFAENLKKILKRECEDISL